MFKTYKTSDRFIKRQFQTFSDLGGGNCGVSKTGDSLAIFPFFIYRTRTTGDKLGFVIIRKRKFSSNGCFQGKPHLMLVRLGGSV